MINYNKNDLINECLNRYYETFSCTLDTADFVPDKYNDKILKYIFKNLKKTFKRIDKEDLLFQVGLIKTQRKQCKADKKTIKKQKKQTKKSKQGGK